MPPWRRWTATPSPRRSTRRRSPRTGNVEVSVYYVDPAGGVSDGHPSAAGDHHRTEALAGVEVGRQGAPSMRVEGCVVTAGRHRRFPRPPFRDLVDVVDDVRRRVAVRRRESWRPTSRIRRRASRPPHGLRVSLTYYGDSVDRRAPRRRPSSRSARCSRPACRSTAEAHQAIGYCRRRVRAHRDAGRHRCDAFRSSVAGNAARPLARARPRARRSSRRRPTYVVARADTPQSVLDDLDASGLVGSAARLRQRLRQRDGDSRRRKGCGSTR